MVAERSCRRWRRTEEVDAIDSALFITEFARLLPYFFMSEIASSPAKKYPKTEKQIDRCRVDRRRRFDIEENEAAAAYAASNLGEEVAETPRQRLHTLFSFVYCHHYPFVPHILCTFHVPQNIFLPNLIIVVYD
nr:hypothetical protein Iba_chr12bCG19950 [Ipomoea batatas]